MAREGAGDHEFWTHLMVYSNKLAYLQLITVFRLGKQSSQNS